MLEQDLYQAQLTLVIVDKICAAASIIGSVFIARDIKKRWDRKRTSEYLPPTLYLLAHTAVSDIGYSFFPHFLGSWLLPKETGYPLAAGNQATCTAQGYLMIFFVGAASAFRCVLALTYWLTVCRGKPESQLRTKYWKFFLFGFSWAFGLGFAALSWTILLPADSGGWAYCIAIFGREPDTVWFKVWGIVCLLYGVACIILSSFCMISLIRFVYKTEKRMDRFSAERDSTSSRKKTIAATRQGLLYIFAQQSLLAPMTAWLVVVVVLGRNFPMWAWTLTSCLKTTPGFLHSVIHFQPKYSKIRKQEEISRLNALAKTLDITVPGRLTSAILSQSLQNYTGSGQGPLPSHLNQSTNYEQPAGLPQQPKANGDECGETQQSTHRSIDKNNVCAELGGEDADIEKSAESTVPVRTEVSLVEVNAMQ